MIRRRLLLLVLLLALAAGGLLASPVHAQEGGIRCTTTTAQSLIPTGQGVFFSAEPRSTESGNVLFFWSTGDLEGNGGNSDGNIELFRSQLVFRADGKVDTIFQQITHSTGSILGGFNLAPDVSADGRYLAFFSDRHYPASGFDNTDGNFEIFVADLADLTNVQIRQITNTTQGSSLYPSISDDGMRIAFISDNGLDPATAGTVADEDRNLDIYLADLSGATPVFRQITQTPLGTLNEAPSLSGDGSTLVFAASQKINNPEGNQEIFRYNVASGAMEAITSTAGGTHEMPVVSGNGTRIAFVSDQRLDPTVNIVGQRQVFLHPNPATGNGFLQVSDTVGADNFNPNISADGNRVIYQRQDGSGQRVVLYDSISQSRQVFSSRPNPTTGEVGQPILSGNGTVLFYEDEGGISTVECSISDLGLTAAVTPTTAVAGESQTQVWTVSNLDQAVASDVQIRASLPAGFQIMQIEPGGICSQNGQQIACAYSRLGIGASEVMTVTTAIDPDVTGAPVTNVAVSSASSADRNPANNALALSASVLAQADLQIAKSANPDTALRTEPITYTLVVYNDGPSVARQVQMTDSLPSALDFLSSDLCSPSGGALLCALGDMAPGARITATVRTRVNTAVFAEQEIVNSAFVLSSQTSDPLPLNNTVAITNSINTKFDLSVTKTVAPTPLLAGGPLTYTIVVTNSGPSVADAVRLSDTLPAEIFNITTPTTTLGLCTAGLSFTCDFGALNRGQVVTVTVSGMLSPTLSGVITNTAAVFSLLEANADRQPSNDISVLVTPIEQQADLLAEKFATPAGSVAAGDTLTYTLGVTNGGPSLADNVTISDTLPAGVTITGLATSLGQCTGSTLVSCQIGSLAPGERATVTVTVRVNSTTLGVLTNTLSVQSTTQDPETLNNDASVATTVTDAANLVLSKTASVAVATAGQSSFFYTLVVGNSGPSLARSVLLTDTLPSGVTYVESTPPAGATCSHAAGVVTCALGSVTAGISQTVRLDVALAAGATGNLVNTATVSTSAVDPTGDNTATATVIASQSADLQVTKRAVIDNLNVGGTVTYTVNVDNFGPSNATGVVISDLLPVGLTSPVVSVDRGSYSQATSLWTVGALAAGQKVTMTVAGGLGAAASGQVITNTALLHALDQTDPALFNNGQFVTFTVPLNADVALVKSASALTPAVQSLVTFVLTATNSGPETATDVQVFDFLPAELSFVSAVASQGAYSNTTGIWAIGSLGNGSEATLSILARVVGSGSFINTATISAAEYDDSLGDNQSSVALTVAPAADLRLEQAASSATPNVGDTLRFTVTLTNDGPDAASGVEVRNLLSAGATGATIIPAAGTTYSTTSGLWSVPLITAGESLSLVISKTVTASGVQSNQAEVMASSLFDPDSTPGNGVGNGEDDQTTVTVTMPPAADLAVQISASGGQLVGQDVLLQIQLTNNGPDVATNIVLTETMPPDLTFSTHLVVGPGVFVPATGRWTIPSLAVGEFTILNVTARVGPGAAGQVVTDELEGVSLDQYDPGQFPNNDSVSFLVGGADLIITKSVDRTNADVNDQVVYTVTVVNSGPSATANVRITDSLPISLTGILSATSAGVFGPNTPGAPGVWTIPELAVGASETLVLTGTVIPGTANRVITNTISAATSAVADGDSTNHTPAAGFRVTAADLVLQKSATITQPQEGESFFYILNVTNLGPDPATNVVVTDTMSTGITATVAGAGYDVATGRWDVGSINPGQSKSLLLTVNPIVGVGGGLVIVDPIDAKEADQEDPIPAISAAARVTITVVGADLRLVKSVSKTTPDVGETVSFTVTFTNPGPYPTGAVVVTDTLPVGLTLAGSPTVTAGSLAVDGTNRIFTWTHTSAATGLTARLRLTATVDSGTGGQSLVNRARILSAQQPSGTAMPDPVVSNNTVTATVTPQAADLTIALVDSPDPAEAGATLLYSAVISNTGPTAAANQTVTVTLPASVVLTSASPACDTSGFPTLVCASATSLGVNASRTFTVAVTNNAVTTLNASASVSTTTPEINTDNNSASASTTVVAADPVKLVITGSGSQTASNSQNLTITAYDSLGNVAAGYTGDKSLSFSGANAAPDGTNPTVKNSSGAAIAFGADTTITFASGVATDNGAANGVLRLVKAETATLSVTDGSISSSGGDNLTVVVSPATAAALVIGGSSAQTAGDSQDLTLTAQDSFSNTATGYTGDKTLTFSGANAAPDGANPTVTDKDGAAIAFGADTTITFASGVATVSSGSNGALTLYATETATVSASDSSIDSTGGGDLVVTVGSASAVVLVVSGSSTQTAGVSQSLTITAQDSYSNTATGYTGSKSLTFSGASAAPDGTNPAVVNSSGVSVTFGSATAINFTSGVATVSGGANGVLALYAAETATVSASDGTIDSTGGGDLIVAVGPGAASRLVFATQPSSSASAGGTFSQQPVVQVRDQFENVAAVSDDISLAAFADSGCSVAVGGTLNGSGPIAAVNGIAAFNTVSYSVAETIRLQATDASNGTVATACSNAITVGPGAAGSLTVETEPGGATAGGAFTTQPVIALRDGLGNIVTSDSTSTVTAAVQSGPGGFAASTTTVTLANGIATFTNLRLDVVGTYTLTFSTSAGAFTVSSAGFTVSHGSPAKLVISGASSQSAGSSQNLTVTAQDSVGNTAASFDGDKTLAFGGAGPAPNAAPPTVTDKNGAAIAFGLPTTITFSSGVATASSGSNGSLTLVQAVTATVAVTDTTSGITSVPSGNLTVTVSAAAASRLVIGGSATQTAGITQSLTITALDSFGNLATGYTGSKSLTFGGAGAAPNGSQPSVRNSSGVTVTFGSGTTISFSSGVAAASGNGNGVLRLVKAETATVAVTDTGGAITSAPSGNLTVTVSAATAANLVVSGAASQIAGTTQNLTITAQDAFSNTAASYTGSKSLTFSGASAAPDGTNPTVKNSSGVSVTFGSATAISFSSGVATVSGGNNGVLALFAAETATVAAGDGSIDSTGGDLVVAVSSGPASRLLFTTEPGNSATAGVDFAPQPVVEVRDAFENAAAVSDNITLSAFTNSGCTGAASGALGGAGPVAAVNGVATFTGVNYSQAGTIRLKATDASNGTVTTACSSAVSVAAGTAGSLTVETQPGSATAGSAFTAQPVIALRDSLGNVVSSDSTSTVTVTVQSGPGGFTASTTSGVLVSGVFTFTNLRLDTAGSYTLRFAASAGAFTVDSASFAVSPGSAARLVISGASSQTAGATQPITITAQDNFNNTAASYTGSKSLTFSGANSSPGGANPTVTNSSGAAVNFGSATAINFSSGIATVSGGSNGLLRLVKVENATVSVSDGSINSTGGGDLAVTVTPGAAAKLVIGGSAAHTAGLTQTLTITALDSVGNVDTTYTGSKSLTFSGASAAPDGTQPTVKNSSGAAVNFGSATAINFSSGIATVSGGNNGVMTLFAAENATIAASDGAISATGSDRLSVAVSPAAPEHLAFSSQPSSSATAGSNFAQQPVVQVQDQFDNVAAVNHQISLTAFTDAGCTSEGGGTLSGGGPLAAVNGVASFSGVTYSKAETIRLKASDNTDGAISSACSNEVAVSPDAGAQLAVTNQPGNATVLLAFVQQPVVEVRDSSSNLVTSDSSSLLTASVLTGPAPNFHASSTVQVSFSSGVATFTNLRLDTAGSYTLRFTITPGGLTVDSDPFTVAGAAAARLVISGAVSQTAGDSQDLTITAKDSLGNTATSYTGSKNLTFGGANAAPDGSQPTVTGNTGVPQSFSATTAIDFVNGVATVSGGANGALVLVKTESATIAVTDGSISATGTDRLTVNVSPGAADNLIFSQQPGSTATAGVDFSPQPAVQIRDQFDNPTADTNTIVLTAFTDAACTTGNEATGTLNGGSGTAANAGVASFSGVDYTKAETIHLKATSGALTIACSSGVTVSPTAAAKLVIGGSATQAAGNSQSLVITAQDSFGNTATSYDGLMNLTFSGASTAPNGSSQPIVVDSSDTAVSFGTPTGINFSNGVASVSGGNNGVLTLFAAETATVSVSDPGSSIDSTGGGDLVVVVSGADPHNLIFNTQPSPNATAGQPFGQSPVVHIRDEFHNLSPSGDTIVLTAFAGSGCTNASNGTLSNGSANGVAGVASFAGVSYTKAEIISLRASDSTTGGVSTACSNSISLSAGPAAKYVVTVSGPPIAGSAVTVNAQLADANDNPVSTSGKVVTWSSTNGGTFGSPTSTTGGTGLATVLFTTNTAAGTVHTVTGASPDPFTGTSSSFTTLVGAFTKLQILVPGETAAPGTGTGKTGTPSTQTAGTAFAVTVRAVDANWNLVSTATDTVGITSSDGAATLPANGLLTGGTAIFTVTLQTPGTATLTASDISDSNILSNTSPSISVNSAFTITKTAFPDLVIAGQQITYTVTITRNGSSAASNLLLTDTLPVTVTGVMTSASPELGCTVSGTITCSLGSLDANASVALTITGTVSPTALHDEQIVNSAVVSADGMTIAESAQVTTTVNTLADLEITKSEFVTDTVVGAVITYTLRITNSGPSYASAVYVTDLLPISVSFGSVIEMTPANLFEDAITSINTVSWMTSTLPLVDGLITFTGTITGSGTFSNSVVITSTTDDNAPANNSSATAGFTVAGGAMAASLADLWLYTESFSAMIPLNAPTEYILRAGNRGPLAVGGARIVIQSTANLAVHLLTDPQITCPRRDGAIVCALPPLQPGDEIGIAVAIPTALPGLLDSIWTIEAGLFDPNPEDNRITRRWIVGSVDWRYFLPFLQSQVDPERNRPNEMEIYLPAMGSP